jgi:hypothetical protein
MLFGLDGHLWVHSVVVWKLHHKWLGVFCVKHHDFSHCILLRKELQAYNIIEKKEKEKKRKGITKN